MLLITPWKRDRWVPASLPQGARSSPGQASCYTPHCSPYHDAGPDGSPRQLCSVSQERGSASPATGSSRTLQPQTQHPEASPGLTVKEVAWPLQALPSPVTTQQPKVCLTFIYIIAQPVSP